MAARDDVDGDVNLLVTGTAVTLADDEEECEDLWKIEPPSRRQPGCAFTLRDPHALDKPAPPPVYAAKDIHRQNKVLDAIEGKSQPLSDADINALFDAFCQESQDDGALDANNSESTCDEGIDVPSTATNASGTLPDSGSDSTCLKEIPTTSDEGIDNSVADKFQNWKKIPNCVQSEGALYHVPNNKKMSGDDISENVSILSIESDMTLPDFSSESTDDAGDIGSVSDTLSSSTDLDVDESPLSASTYIEDLEDIQKKVNVLQQLCASLKRLVNRCNCVSSDDQEDVASAYAVSGSISHVSDDDSKWDSDSCDSVGSNHTYVVPPSKKCGRVQKFISAVNKVFEKCKNTDTDIDDQRYPDNDSVDILAAQFEKDHPDTMSLSTFIYPSSSSTTLQNMFRPGSPVSLSSDNFFDDCDLNSIDDPVFFEEMFSDEEKNTTKKPTLKKRLSNAARRVKKIFVRGTKGEKK